MLQIRKAESDDREDVWSILKSIIEKGDAYAFSPNTSKEEMLTWWFASEKHTYVATDGEKVAGTFVIKDNQPGLGSHIANAAYAVSPDVRGKGTGKMMGVFSLKEAKKLGYLAMQYNLVVKTNESAVRLWKNLGFEIIGEIPEAFNHAELGYVNAYIMYQKL